MRKGQRRSEVERFWEKVRKTEGCWEWTGAPDADGYGRLVIFVDERWKMMKAHRFSWFLETGELPAHLLVLHHCDNRKCVRPSHLFLGTAEENVQDRVRKNRTGRMCGAKNPQTKITEAHVLKARQQYAQGVSVAQIARDLAVPYSAIRFALVGRSWKHVKEVQ